MTRREVARPYVLPTRAARATALRSMRKGLHEVYVNGSAKFEGTYDECVTFAKGRLALDASAEIYVSKI